LRGGANCKIDNYAADEDDSYSVPKSVEKQNIGKTSVPSHQRQGHNIILQNEMKDTTPKRIYNQYRAYSTISLGLPTSETKEDAKNESRISKVIIDTYKKNLLEVHEGNKDTVESDLLLDEIEIIQKKKKKKKKNPKKKKLVNAKFECFVMSNRFGTQPNVCQTYDPYPLHESTRIHTELISDLPKTNRMILIDNLPIDTTTEEISQLYSRCGPLESIDIFNLRPSLDPGESFSKQQKKITGAKAANDSETRRTPVYGILEFKDDDGYKTATTDMLRIFGMVIRRHAVRSIPACTMKTLHIENIQPEFEAVQLVHMISDLFHPDMYIVISLENPSPYIKPTSCEIRFPSFEVATYALRLLSKVSIGDKKCVLNWMETPKHANDYWTRKISY